MSDLSARRVRFRRLHQSGCFVLPNPWDAGSARYLAHLGFGALATSSAGLAFSRGLPDEKWVISRELVLSHIAEIVQATTLPVNADFESGYGRTVEEVGANVRACVETGVAGLSIEDSTGDAEQPLYELSEAVERLRAARQAIDESGSGVLLTGRAECHLVGHPDPLRESIRRLSAYAEAGADVLYAPGLKSREAMAAVIAAVAPKPVNILVGGNLGLSVAEVAALGARRISVGSALARAAWGGFIRAATALATEGSFAGFDGAASFAELNGVFRGIVKP